MKGFFITGIGTGIGKTVTSAVVVEALNAGYWKPVQSGNMDFTDSDFIKEYTLHRGEIFPEEFVFPDAVSPHLAARLDHKFINILDIRLPKTNAPIVVEGAGGLLSPLSEKALIKDLIIKLQLPVILVSMNYLGSINHTLLAIEYLNRERIPFAGLIFNGESDIETENFILSYTGVRLLGKIPKADLLSKGFIAQQADQIKKNLTYSQPVENESAPPNDLPIDYESF